MNYELWVVNIQNKKPFSYEKIRLITLSQKEANKVWETSIKHPLLGDNVLWLSFKMEMKYGLPAMTYCVLENFTWTKE